MYLLVDDCINVSSLGGAFLGVTEASAFESNQAKVFLIRMGTSLRTNLRIVDFALTKPATLGVGMVDVNAEALASPGPCGMPSRAAKLSLPTSLSIV